MTKILTILLMGIVTAPLSAHEIGRQDGSRVDALGEMARLHAQKTCARGAERQRTACEAGQIRALAETAAAVPSLRPANMPSGEFAAMIENRASAQTVDWRANTVDCRVNVC